MPRFVSFFLCGALLVTGCAQAPVERAADPAPSGEASPTPAVTRAPAATPASPASPSSPSSPSPPVFQGGVFRIGPELRSRIVWRSWHPGCPVPIEDLRHVQVSYWSFQGKVRTGPLIVHEKVAEDILWVFRRLFGAGFRIKHIVLPPRWRPPQPEDYWNPEPTSPTAAFNCRPATGSTVLSQHSYGWAIDINPLQNPYVRSDGTVLRHIAKPYRNRSLRREGMIHDGDIVVRSFARIGWEWGGHWQTLKDYMHFSLTGR
jgi:hypothetical protein